MFTQIAQKVKEVVTNSRCEYKTVLGNKSATIHPGSVLFQRKPYAEAIVYTISFYSFLIYIFLINTIWFIQQKSISDVLLQLNLDGYMNYFQNGLVKWCF